MSKEKMHNLKTWPVAFDAVWHGGKTAEYRQNDRDFKIGQYLNLREWSPDTKEYTGNCLLARINHIVEGGQFGIPEGYCVMSITVDKDNLFSPPPVVGDLREKIAQEVRDYANEQIKILTTGVIPSPPADSKEVADSVLSIIDSYLDHMARSRGYVKLDFVLNKLSMYKGHGIEQLIEYLKQVGGK